MRKNAIQFDFTGARFAVTGASSGLGREIATALAAAGGTVLALARREDRLRQLRDQFPDRIHPVTVDVLNLADLSAAVKSFAADGRLDGTVHAAGINEYLPLRGWDWGTAETILRTSLHAAIELLRAATAATAAAPQSSHVWISSIAGFRGQPGFAAYAAAKAAAAAAARSFAVELAGRGIRVNTVAPGWIKSELTERLEKMNPDGAAAVIARHPLGIGSPADVAGLVLFLLSPEARWITGAEFVVDGGFSC